MGREYGVDFTGLMCLSAKSIDPKIDRPFFSLGSWGELVLWLLTMEEINATSLRNGTIQVLRRVEKREKRRLEGL
jgi:hypothetical protein